MITSPVRFVQFQIVQNPRHGVVSEIYGLDPGGQLWRWRWDSMDPGKSWTEVPMPERHEIP